MRGFCPVSVPCARWSMLFPVRMLQGSNSFAGVPTVSRLSVAELATVEVSIWYDPISFTSVHYCRLPFPSASIAPAPPALLGSAPAVTVLSLNVIAAA